jgi:hypothetical protein
MPVSQPEGRDATPGTEFLRVCDECGDPSTDETVWLLGFGGYHPDCVAPCACGYLWPRSIVDLDTVIFYCGTCPL